MSETNSLLQAENLVKFYGKRQVVDHVSVEIRQGEIVGLLGPNGAGKTTTFYMITGMIKPSAGKVFLSGSEVTRMAMYCRSRLGIGYLAQEPSVFRTLSVEDNIMAIIQTLPIGKKERKKRLELLLGELGIEKLRKNK